MHAQTIFAVAVTMMQAVAAQTVNAVVCGDKNLNGECQIIPGDGVCYQMIKKDWASSFRTNGLTCTFYDSDNCFDPVLGPGIGEQGDLSKGNFNDRVNSALCK